MPYTSPSTADPSLIINRARPPTWVFLPPSSENSSPSSPEPDSDSLPPYPPPPTRTPPLIPLAPPPLIHIPSSPSPSPSKFKSNQESYEYNNHSELIPENKDKVPPFSKALFFDSLQSHFDSPPSPSISISPSKSSSSSETSGSPKPQLFHPLSHCRLSKPSPPRNRPPIPLMRDISASEFYTSSRPHPEEEDINDWVIIPPDGYSISASPSSPPPVDTEHLLNEERERDNGRKMSTLGYLFSFLMSTKGYSSAATEDHEDGGGKKEDAGS